MITQERVRELFKYDPNTGDLIRRIRVKGPRTGSAAGVVCKCKDTGGHIIVMVDGKRYPAHRLIWLYVYGYMPEHLIDHKNGVPDDNRLCNLREASHRCNNQNCRLRKDNKTGFPGVFMKGNGRYEAYIRVDRKQYCLGTYDNRLEAALARLTAEIQCPEWTCNYQSEIVKRIKQVWPGLSIDSIFPREKI